MNTIETPGFADPSETLPTWLEGALGVSPDGCHQPSGLYAKARETALFHERTRTDARPRGTGESAVGPSRESLPIRIGIWWTRVRGLA